MEMFRSKIMQNVIAFGSKCKVNLTCYLTYRYIQYKVENGSIFDEIARKAFISLHSEPYIEPALLTFDQKRLKWLQRYMRKQLKAERKGKKLLIWKI